MVKIEGVLKWEHEVKDGVIEYCFYNKDKEEIIVNDKALILKE